MIKHILKHLEKGFMVVISTQVPKFNILFLLMNSTKDLMILTLEFCAWCKSWLVTKA